MTLENCCRKDTSLLSSGSSERIVLQDTFGNVWRHFFLLSQKWGLCYCHPVSGWGQTSSNAKASLQNKESASIESVVIFRNGILNSISETVWQWLKKGEICACVMESLSFSVLEQNSNNVSYGHLYAIYMYCFILSRETLRFRQKIVIYQVWNLGFKEICVGQGNISPGKVMFVNPDFFELYPLPYQ